LDEDLRGLDCWMSEEGTEELRTVARSYGLTLNTLVQGAWALLLSQYSGRRDLVFGATVSGRQSSLPGVEAMVGLFINTLPVRVQVSPDATLVSWLEKIQEQQVEMRQYEHTPLIKIHQWSDIHNGAHLFDSLFIFENYPAVNSNSAHGNTIQPAEETNNNSFRAQEKTHYGLTLLAGTRPNLLMRCYFDTKRFDEPSVKRLLGHLQRLLNWMAANPQSQVRQLSLLTEAERYQLLVDWNQTRREYPAQSLAELFERQVRERAEATAVVCEEERLSYEGLNRRANQLARWLQSLGCGPESRVGVCLERSIDMLVGLLGILKAGGAYVPLDPDYPAERLDYMLKDAQVELVLTQSRLMSLFDNKEVVTVCLDSDGKQIARQSDENPLVVVHPENLAYITYTSGSMGKPKGVSVNHRSVVRLVSGVEYVKLGPGTRTLQMAPLAFDAATFEIWGALLEGGVSVVMSERATSAREIGRTIRDQQVTTMWLTASLFNAVIDESEEELAGLEQLLVGGEALSVRHVRRAQEALKGTELINGYGPTEGTTFSCCYKIKGDCGDRGWGIPIGRPISNTTIYALDERQELAPIGVVGELYIGGDGLARGYLGQPGQTAERFLPNPYPERMGERLYRTGDLVRYREDGQLEFIGRRDRQVKLRGFRIELGEIEAALLQLHSVTEAVVEMRQQGQIRKHLVAYIVPGAGSSPSDQELRGYLAQRLPEYMIPAAYVFLDELPLTANGKLDRRALPSPELAPYGALYAYEPPVTPAEIILAQIWQEVLGLPRVGVHDNFFRLGGDSILSIQVVARANQAGFSLSAKQIFQCQTIAELAAVAATQRRVEAEQGKVSGEAPLTAIQEWFFEHHRIDEHHWNQSILLEVREPVDLRAMRATVRELVEHHDALRCRYRRQEQGWSQWIEPEESQNICIVVDLSELAEARQREALEDAAEQMQGSLNLEQGPILRVGQVEMGGGRASRLVIIIHHLVVDGVSWRILLEDLERGYRQAQRREEIQLGSKTTSWRYWSQKIKQYAQSEIVGQEIDYWLVNEQHRNGKLPRDYQGGRNVVSAVENITKGLTGEETRVLLTEATHAYYAQVDELLIAALAETIKRWAGNREIMIDVEWHGREELHGDMDLTRTLGWFTTIFPVKIDLTNARFLSETVKLVKEEFRNIPNKGIGFGLLKYLRDDRELKQRVRKIEQGEVAFNYLGQFDQVFHKEELFQLSQEPGGKSQSVRGERYYLIEVSAQVTAGRLQVSWVYNKNVHEPSTIETQTEEYIRQLRLLLANIRNTNEDKVSLVDFPHAMLSQKSLSKVISRLKKAGKAAPFEE